MWCLPTHKRPEKLRRFLSHLAGQDREEHVMLILWRNDPRLPDYAPVLRELPRTWDVHITDQRTCGAKLQMVFERFPTEGFYGFLADDITIGSVGILGELRKDALAGRFAWPNDGVHGPRGATHPCAPGDFLRALGFWAHPRFPHNGFDTILYRVAEALGLSRYRSDLHIIHHHPFTVVAPENGWKHEEWDETYDDAREMNSKAIDDMYDFQANELPKLIDKVKAVYAKST